MSIDRYLFNSFYRIVTILEKLIRTFTYLRAPLPCVTCVILILFRTWSDWEWNRGLNVVKNKNKNKYCLYLIRSVVKIQGMYVAGYQKETMLRSHTTRTYRNTWREIRKSKQWPTWVRKKVSLIIHRVYKYECDDHIFVL